MTLLHDHETATTEADDAAMSHLPIDLDEDPELPETVQIDRPARSIPWSLIAIVGLSLAAVVVALVGVQQHSRLVRQDRQTKGLEQVSGQLVGALHHLRLPAPGYLAGRRADSRHRQLPQRLQ